VAVTDECLDLYRQHPNSHCAVTLRNGEYAPGDPHPAGERYLKWLTSYLQDCGIEDPALWAALQNELWPYRHPWQCRIQRTLRQTAWYGRVKVHGVLRRLLPSS